MSKKLSRRKFLRDSIIGMASVTAMNLGTCNTSEAQAASNFKVFIHLNLGGGLDPLLILPYTTEYSNLNKIRDSKTKINPNSLPELSKGIAFHPNLQGLLAHSDSIRTTLNTGVAMTMSASRSHETASLRMMLGGSEAKYGRYGWGARFYDQGYGELVGLRGGGVGLNCKTCKIPPLKTTNYEALDISTASFGLLGGTAHAGHVNNVLKELSEIKPNRAVGKTEQIYRDAQKGMFNYVDGIKKILDVRTPAHDFYPDTSLGIRFRNLAQSIYNMKQDNSNEKTAFFLSTGGYDLHNNWLTNGNKLMKELGDVLPLFIADMKIMGTYNNIATMIVSEFGRTIKSNGVGTDHGIGFPSFVFGGKVNGGVYGDPLTVAELEKQSGNAWPREVAQERLLIEILEKHMGVDAKKIFDDYDQIPNPGDINLIKT